MSTRARWLRWLTIWLALILTLGLALRTLVGPLLPTLVPWAAGFVLGTSLTFLFVPVPHEEE